MERNTYATSTFIASPLSAVTDYLMQGESLSEYTLYSRMRERIDATTWLGTASGYQSGLYYHVRHREIGASRVVEWHCGTELGRYYHVYPMFLFEPSYFGSTQAGTYYHWISFVDPARGTQMIKEGLPTVHRSEARSLKAQLERRQGWRFAAKGELELKSHTIYVDAPLAESVAFLIDNPTQWGYLMRRDGDKLFDEYDREIRLEITQHDLGEYRVLEHDVHYVATGQVVRTPFVLIPASYAFAQPGARGFLLHRISAWPATGEREVGKQSPDDYDTEAINAKRILEGRAGNLATYARGCSYMP
ncbi:MAG: hypothetical protein JO257_31225 [Deltaproteobacteria bacterium]|nr:hypothetical protein [Deltaproteobacteria bacterium]